jgi:hypothetical protein
MPQYITIDAIFARSEKRAITAERVLDREVGATGYLW